MLDLESGGVFLVLDGFNQRFLVFLAFFHADDGTLVLWKHVLVGQNSGTVVAVLGALKLNFVLKSAELHMKKKILRLGSGDTFLDTFSHAHGSLASP